MYASCVSAAIADAVSSVTAGTADAASQMHQKDILVNALRRCAESSIDCMSAAFPAELVESAADDISSAARQCLLAEELANGLGDRDGGTQMGMLPVQAWALVGGYNAIQMVVMPWVFIWIFSGSVLGLVRFIRFQYDLLRVGVDVIALSVLFLSITLEESVVEMVHTMYALLRRPVRKQRLLMRTLRNATTFAQHQAAQKALAEFHQPRSECGPRTQSLVPEMQERSLICRTRSGRYLQGTYEEHLAWLQRTLRSDDTLSDLAQLEPLIARDSAGIDWLRANGYRQQYIEVLEKLSHRLASACLMRRELSANEELLAWLKARQKAVGRTALCLSGGGSLAMHHMGVCRFLLEQGLMPEIISSVSGGSIVGAFLAIHHDEELLDHVLVPSIVNRHAPHRWFPSHGQEIINFFKIGVLVPTEDFENTCQAFFGTWTFEEAFARTGREVSIVISSNFSRELPACVMLNHMTTPRVTLASAVATSCAALGVMKPRGLIVKDSVTSELSRFDLLGKSFADGSFAAEVPKDYLRSLYGASQFLVSQVNPHVSALMSNKEGFLEACRHTVGQDLKKRARRLSEDHLMPSFFGRAMCNATKHLSQDFAESQAGLTLFPSTVGLSSVRAAVANPTESDMEEYLLEGQRMAWRRSEEIRVRMLLEVSLFKEIAATEALMLQGQEKSISSKQFSSLQPPPLQLGKK